MMDYTKLDFSASYQFYCIEIRCSYTLFRNNRFLADSGHFCEVLPQYLKLRHGVTVTR